MQHQTLYICLCVISVPVMYAAIERGRASRRRSYLKLMLTQALHHRLHHVQLPVHIKRARLKQQWWLGQGCACPRACANVWAWGQLIERPKRDRKRGMYQIHTHKRKYI